MGAKAAVVPTGSTQANGTNLTSVNANSIVTVSGANGTKAITLPTSALPMCIRINSQVTGASNTLAVFGHASDSDTINGATGASGYVQMAGTTINYCAADGATWLTY